MTHKHSWFSSLRAALCVAGIYGFFLIFAQFALVEMLRAGGVGKSMQTALLGAMAVAGMLAGFFVAWRGASVRLTFWAMAVAAACAAWSGQCQQLASWGVVAAATGAALGVATVSLAVLLPSWCGVAWVGLGTGLGYAACNVPMVFTARPAEQAWIAVGFALLAMLSLPSPQGKLAVSEIPSEERSERTTIFSPILVLVVFTALVWLDSAAFFVIQHQPDLKAGTWGESMLWRNGAVHLAAGGMAAWMLASGRARHLPLAALLPLGLAAISVNHPSGRHLAGWLYPIGVSLYSAALVAWPGWFSGAVSSRAVGWRAAWLFAVAGWFGSANGIGMAQQLSRVPGWFVAVATGVIVAAKLWSDPRQRRSFWVVVAIAALAQLPGWPTSQNRAGRLPAGVASEQWSAAAQRGRETYISEGCLHCHSRYVRPGSADELPWGPTRPTAEVMAESPVLIGNRRQGPDLSQVGARRSAAWLKLHFIDPAKLVPGSAMPSYEALFQDRRGDDLIAFLRESSTAAVPERMRMAAAWRPDTSAPPSARGGELFARHCAVCHGQQGLGNGPLSRTTPRLPGNLARGPFIWTHQGDEWESRTARVIKFGIIGMDMPGHELLPDADIRALTQFVLTLRQTPPPRQPQLIVPPRSMRLIRPPVAPPSR